MLTHVTFRKRQNVEKCNKLKIKRKPVAEKLDQSVFYAATTAENIRMKTFVFSVLFGHSYGPLQQKISN